MSPSDITRVQTYLRKLLGNQQLTLDPPVKKGASVEMRVGDEFIGTVHRDDEDGEVSFAVTISILDEDLPPSAQAKLPPPARR